MTSIDFYTHCADPMRVVVQLVAKAWQQHGHVRVLTGDETMTAALDDFMWKWPATGFLPHCRLSASLMEHTPIIVDHVPEHRGPAAVLVNMQSAPPAFFGRFERLAEIVGAEPDAVAAGRERWKFYNARGYALRSHNLAERG
ncbi:MAG: DNA polymerase III subunit chi [Pseudomonadota bacterium]|nr:DNA polymerase III subunit chi [Pseudomonadota bacterium]